MLAALFVGSVVAISVNNPESRWSGNLYSSNVFSSWAGSNKISVTLLWYFFFDRSPNKTKSRRRVWCRDFMVRA